MVKLAVISDSHWGKVRLEMFARHAQDAGYDAVIHCGDGLSDAKWLEKTLSVPVRAVGGNCDPRWSCERELRATYGNVRFLAVHGDQYGVKLDLSRLSYYAEEIGAQAVLFGHTHQPFAGYVGSVMMVNPGSLAQGRYAEIHIENGRAAPFLKEL